VITKELAPVLYAILVRDHLKILNWESKPTADSAAPPHDWRGAEEFSGLADGAVHPRRSLGGVPQRRILPLSAGDRRPFLTDS